MSRSRHPLTLHSVNAASSPLTSSFFLGVDLPSAPALCKCPHQYHSMDLTLPVFSYSYELFYLGRKVNSFLFNRFGTLRAKHPGWGEPARILPFQSLSNSSARYLVTSLLLSFRFSITIPALLSGARFNSRDQ